MLMTVARDSWRRFVIAASPLRSLLTTGVKEDGINSTKYDTRMILTTYRSNTYTPAIVVFAYISANVSWAAYY